MDREWIREKISEIDIERIDRDLAYFCGYEKLTGEDEALRSVEYIAAEMEKEGIPCRTEWFEAYLSNPVDSSLYVEGVCPADIPCRPRSFSAGCRELQAELVYDRSTADTGIPPLKREEFYRTVRGKIVIGYGYDERYAKVLEQYGAAAWIQVWTSPEVQIHEDTVSPVWGTPDMDSCFMRLRMPVTAVAGPDGERLIKAVCDAEKAGRPLRARMSSNVKTGVKRTALPVVQIPGKSEDFLLLSGHYDTWYIGAFDNGTANAAMMELARLLYRSRDHLERSVRIAWWPGHSNGRYMGSAWYCDHHWDELREHCFAHINLDLLGSKGTDETLAVRTGGLEGDEWLQSLISLADEEAVLKTGRIGRGADQSFWGADVAYHINPRYEASPGKKKSSAPGPGVYWWHTAEDTYDKIDLAALKKDTGVAAALVLGLLTEPVLPADFDGYFGMWDEYLRELEKNPEQAEGIREILSCLRQVKELCQVLDQEGAENGTEGDPAYRNRLRCLAGGVVNRLMHSSGSPYEQDTAFAYGPLHLLAASGRLRAGESPEDWHLFYHTTFVRQRNRMVTELGELLGKMKMRRDILL